MFCDAHGLRAPPETRPRLRDAGRDTALDPSIPAKCAELEEHFRKVAAEVRAQKAA